ncbi:hypothetical protein FOHLNKBM_0378 [Methylobacterium longum]|jgi:hypothetical protein|nr:hypothetical protein [Methylobacterium sp. E-046]GJE09355.1 hypothetical protein FOHLNKBM_0378 [Methylobacterium longum]
MPDPSESTDCSCERLRCRIALSILVDEQVVAALASALQILREKDCAGVVELEHAIRTHRIGILKRRAILGAAGVEV